MMTKTWYCPWFLSIMSTAASTIDAKDVGPWSNRNKSLPTDRSSWTDKRWIANLLIVGEEQSSCSTTKLPQIHGKTNYQDESWTRVCHELSLPRSEKKEKKLYHGDRKKKKKQTLAAKSRIEMRSSLSPNPKQGMRLSSSNGAKTLPIMVMACS